MNRTIKLTIAYDGTDFSGWQRQSEHRSVQEEIEKALAKMHGHAVNLLGSGRTDTGVHARGQVASFITDIVHISPERFETALNSLMPHDIRIMEAKEVRADFHPRFDARSRSYRYFMSTAKTPLPSGRKYEWHLFHSPNIALLNSMAACLIGEHDFSTFSSSQDQSQSMQRYIQNASFFMQGDQLVFQITGNAFLWRMVRSLVGTMIVFERRGKTRDDFNNAFLACDRNRAGPTAPSLGLFLWAIDFYDEDVKAESL